MAECKSCGSNFYPSTCDNCNRDPFAGISSSFLLNYERLINLAKRYSGQNPTAMSSPLGFVKWLKQTGIVS